jgi:hypothetical protein
VSERFVSKAWADEHFIYDHFTDTYYWCHQGAEKARKDARNLSRLHRYKLMFQLGPCWCPSPKAAIEAALI